MRSPQQAIFLEDSDHHLWLEYDLLPGAEISAEQRFKRDVITPLMARLLGVAAYDPQTGRGFSYFGCHPREEE